MNKVYPKMRKTEERRRKKRRKTSLIRKRNRG
jgi:hypothetical protein